MSESPSPDSPNSTRWSLVLAAGQRGIFTMARALADLCQTYWPAVYAFVRRQISNVHEAQDLTQGFFTQLLEKDLLAVAQPTRGRFSFLSAHGGQQFSQQRAGQAESPQTRRRQEGALARFSAARFQAHFRARRPVDARADLRTPVGPGLARASHVPIARRMHPGRQGPAFRALQGGPGTLGHVHGGDRRAAWRISENAAKVAVHRLRKRYRELLRQEVAHTLADPAEIDDEIRQLFAALTAG